MDTAVNNKVTIEDVDKSWEKFEKIKETAEQHAFPLIFIWDMKMTPLYNDLHINWDEHHAEVFLRGMHKMFEALDQS